MSNPLWPWRPPRAVPHALSAGLLLSAGVAALAVPVLMWAAFIAVTLRRPDFDPPTSSHSTLGISRSVASTAAREEPSAAARRSGETGRPSARSRTSRVQRPAQASSRHRLAARRWPTASTVRPVMRSSPRPAVRPRAAGFAPPLGSTPLGERRSSPSLCLIVTATHGAARLVGAHRLDVPAVDAHGGGTQKAGGHR